MRRTSILKMKPAGNPWVPANPMNEFMIWYKIISRENEMQIISCIIK
jgi:hypothetical protein